MPFCQYCGDQLRSGMNLCAGCLKFVACAPVFDARTGRRLRGEPSLSGGGRVTDRARGESQGVKLTPASAAHFEVLGKVLGKPRMTRQDKWKRRPCVVRYREWSDLLRAECTRQLGEIPSEREVLSVSFTAFALPPKSVSGRRLSKAERVDLIGCDSFIKPDVDNIFKGVLDSLFKSDELISRAGDLIKVFDWQERIVISLSLKEPAA